MNWKTLTVAAMLAGSTVTMAHADWYVAQGEDRSCDVVDEILPGYGKLAGPYATEEEAIAEKGKIARCEEANTDPDPDEDGPAR